jgi:hypothetical protein
MRQQHVVENGEVVDQRHFLKRGLNSKRLGFAQGGEARRLTEDVKAAGIGLRESREQFDAVDFPAPFSPRRACTAPRAIEKLASSTATVAP